MTKIPGSILLLLFVACQSRVLPPEGNRAGAPGETSAYDVVAAEPAWRDLIRHTALQEPDHATHPGPSPDGRFFAYVSTEFGARAQVAVRDTQGVAPLQITNNGGENYFPRISPDGRLLAYASNKDGNWDLYVSRLDAPAAVSQVTFESQDDVAPAWDPEGKRLVYCSRNAGGVWQIVIVDVATRIKTYLGSGLYPDWSPDRKDPMICFQSQPRTPDGRSGVWAVRPDGTGLRELVMDKVRSWSALNPRFSPDGRWIAYATRQRSRESRMFGLPEEADDIWIIRPDGSLDTRLTDDLSAEWWPSWGGDRIFFVSNRDGGQNIFSVRPKPLEESR